jgi:hypothetical protein
MMLAEMSAYDAPILIPAVLGCLMFLAIGANAAAEFWRNVKDKPTGQEVLDKARKEFQPKGDYITRHEWNLRENQLQTELGKLSDENATILQAGSEREKHLTEEINKVQTNLNTKHELNDKRINRSNWMLARLCERNRIPVPAEDENL